MSKVFDTSYRASCSSVGIAARHGDVDSLKMLLEEGRCADVADNRGFRPLHEAVIHDNHSAIRLLLDNESCRKQTDLNWKTFEGETALCLAAKSGSLRSLQLLLEAGADPHAKTLTEEDSFHLAVSRGHNECAKLLLKYGVSVNSCDWDGWSPLHKVAADGMTDMVRLLIDSGANCNLTEMSNQLTPLYLASQNGCTEVVKLLISAGSDVNSPSKHKMYAVHTAVQGSHLGCLEHLLLAGAKSNALDQNNLLPLHIAIAAKNQKNIKRIINLLLLHCDKDRVSQCSVSPVTFALWKRRYDLAQLLILGGVGINCHVSADGQPPLFDCEELPMKATPIHMAAYLGLPSILQMLLEAGADPNVKVTDSCALAEACTTHNVEDCYQMVKTLLDYGASLSGLTGPNSCCNICYDELRLAKMVAFNDGSHRAIRLLFSRGLSPNRLSLNCSLPSDNQFFISLCLPHEETALKLVILKLDYTDRFPVCLQLLRKAKNENWPLYDEVQAILDNARPLKHLCRLKIREILGVTKLQNTKFILSLPLPRVVLDYLLYA